MTAPTAARSAASASEHRLYERHRETLGRALEAIRDRTYWSAYAEIPSPSAYGEGAAEAGQAAFEAHRGTTFELDQPGVVGEAGDERSPYGFEPDVRYPR